MYDNGIKIKRSMGGSNNGHGRSLRTADLKKRSKKLRRRQAKRICRQEE